MARIDAGEIKIADQVKFKSNSAELLPEGERARLLQSALLDRDGQRVRPVYARVRRDEGAIYILSDIQGCKLDQIQANPNVSLAFSDERANDYVVINGTAEVRHDPEKARDVWRFSDETFFKSPDNPDLRVIAVTPVAAELWDGSNLLITGAKMLADRLVGTKSELVENAKVDRLD
mgnify:CR=1 FL=1